MIAVETVVGTTAETQEIVITIAGAMVGTLAVIIITERVIMGGGIYSAQASDLRVEVRLK